MQLEFRQRLFFTYILPSIFMMPNFQYLLTLPGIGKWLSNNETLNFAIITALVVTPCFAFMEFLDWRWEKNPKPPRWQIPLEFFPTFLKRVFGWISNLLFGLLAGYAVLGIFFVILSTFVLDPPYKFWVWGLTAVVIVIFPWQQALASIKNGLGIIRLKIRRPSAIDG